MERIHVNINDMSVKCCQLIVDVHFAQLKSYVLFYH